MPAPVSVTNRPDILAGRQIGMHRAIGLVEIAVGGLDGQLAALRHRVARIDGEIDQRVFELVGIGKDVPQPARQHGFDRDRFAEGAPQQIGHAGDQLVGVDRPPASSGWRREKASRRCVSSSAARRAPQSGRDQRDGIRGPAASRRCMVSSCR